MNNTPIPEEDLKQISNDLSKNPESAKAKPKKLLLKSNKPFGLIPKKTLTGLRISRKKTFIALIVALAVLSLLLVSFVAWFNVNLQPVDASSKNTKLVAVTKGMTYQDVEKLLSDNKLIKNSFATDVYLFFNGYRDKLKAGVYSLSQSESTQAIIKKIVDGKSTMIAVTFLPGDTIAADKKRLLALGYSKDEIEAAFSAIYDYPVFESKPASADLEGYVYGETYYMPADATVKNILERTFEELNSVVETNNLKSKYANQGLSLYEGITLASIVQKEIKGDGSGLPTQDQKMIAGVFLNRLRSGISLGADPTYQYIADKLGVPRDINIDSPYNTRRYAGLPPGPISSPGLTALLSVASPANTDYLFFLSGDDDKMYYAKTNAEHQQNVAKYCQKKCQIL